MHIILEKMLSLFTRKISIMTDLAEYAVLTVRQNRAYVPQLPLSF